MGELIVVFDIDGTLADNSHRTHYVQSKPKNWKAYNSLMHLDSRHDDILYILDIFCERERVFLCSGREEIYRDVTEKWLAENNISYEKLFMRGPKDYRQDSIVKVELLNQIKSEYGEPFLWFDDRQQVVDAIRAEGIRVLQVNDGKF